MEWFWWSLLIIFLIWRIGENQRRERIKKSREFNVPKVHGEREFASDKELKKAGLL